MPVCKQPNVLLDRIAKREITMLSVHQLAKLAAFAEKIAFQRTSSIMLGPGGVYPGVRPPMSVVVPPTQQPQQNRSTAAWLGNTAKDFAVGAGLSTLATTGGLGAAGFIANKMGIPFAGKLFNNAAKESILFLDPMRSYKLLKRLPQAANLASRQMELLQKGLNTDISRQGLANQFKNITPGGIENALGDFNAARKTIRRTQAFQRLYGESPTDTLEKGIGVANGIMNLGVGGAVGALPNFYPGSSSQKK